MSRILLQIYYVCIIFYWLRIKELLGLKNVIHNAQSYASPHTTSYLFVLMHSRGWLFISLIYEHNIFTRRTLRSMLYIMYGVCLGG